MELEKTLYPKIKKIPKKQKAITTICEATGFSAVWVWRVLKGHYRNAAIEKAALILIDNYNESIEKIEVLIKQENNNNNEIL